MSLVPQNAAPELQRIEQLLDAGQFEEALQAVELFEHQEIPSVNDSLMGQLLKSRLMIGKGAVEEGIQLAVAVFHKSQPLGMNLNMVDALMFQASALWHIARYDEGLVLLEQSNQHLSTLVQIHPEAIPPRKAWILLTKSTILWWKGDLEQALVIAQQALSVWEELGHKLRIAEALLTIGLIYNSKGNFEQALAYFEKSLVLREEVGNKHSMSLALVMIGWVYQTLGELDPAIEYLEKGLALAKEYEYKRYIGNALERLGAVYRQKGDWAQAFTYIEQSLLLYEEIGNNLLAVYALFQLITVTVDMSALDQAHQYLQKLQQLNVQEDLKLIRHASQVAEAMLLKTSLRAQNRVKAQELLEKVATDTPAWFEVTISALFHLCDLLLVELQFTGDPEVLDEIQQFVIQLQNIAKPQPTHSLPETIRGPIQYSPTILAESYLLQAKLALLNLDIPQARQMLTQAQMIAEEKGLHRLAQMISQEHDTLLAQLPQWEILQAQGAPPQELNEMAGFEVQLTRLTQQRAPDPPELHPEDPTLFLILHEGGLPLFSHSFKAEQSLNEHLIGGFLTAISEFGQDALAASGAIDRITYHDYTAAVKPLASLLVCYIYQGPSYLALQKLDQFLARIQESPDLHHMLTVAHSSDTNAKALGSLDPGIITDLQQLILEIFTPENVIPDSRGAL